MSGQPRKPNALVATVDVAFGNALFCETLPFLHGTEAIDAYEDQYEEDYPHSVIMIGKTEAIGLIHQDAMSDDPRSTFYMMNHGKFARQRNVRLPFKISQKEREAHGDMITIEVCADKQIKAGEEIRFDYFDGDPSRKKDISWA